MYTRNLVQEAEGGRPSPGPEDCVLFQFGGTHVDAGVLGNVDHQQVVDDLVNLFLLFPRY